MNRIFLSFLLCLAPLCGLAQQRVPAYPALASPAGGDILYVVDVSNTTDHASGSATHLTLTNLQAWLAAEAATYSNKTFVAPVLGAATATSINGLTITSTTGTFTLTNGKTFSVSNTLTLAGTDGSTLNIGTGGTLGTAAFQNVAAFVEVADLGTNVLNFLTTPNSANLEGALPDKTGTGAAVFNTNAAFVNPDLGTPAAGDLSNCTDLPITTGVSGLGTNVATALATNVGSAGAFVTFNGAGGTPSSITLTNGTGLPPAGVTGTAAILGTNTFTRRQTITQGTANEGIIASTGYSLTGANAQIMVDLAGTWNTTGVPTAIKLNITNTASGTGSKLLDLQVGGTSKFNVDTDGYLTFPFTGDFVRFLKAGASSGGGQFQMMWRETESHGVFCDANTNFFFKFGRGVCAVDVTLGFSSADNALNPDTYLKRREASVMGIEGSSSAGGILEFLQATSGGTPSTNSARIYAKDVSGTAEVFVKDEAGNETQISPHNHTAPASLIDSAFDEIGFSANVYTGVVQYTNQQRKAKGRADYLHVETFAEHNTRLGLTGGAALVQLDWATVQAAKVAERDALRAAWQTRKTAWESDPANSGKPFPDAEPPTLEAKPVPAWLTAQLSARDTYLTHHDTVEQEAASRAAKRVTVGSAVTGLRTWATDAQTATANWDGWTQTQKNAAMKTVVTRFGVLCDRLADLIEAQSLDKN
jgi:hypothetical protein